MYKKFNLNKFENSYLIIIFTLLAIFNQINYLRFEFNEYIIFLPRVLILLFLMLFSVKIFEVLKINNFFIHKKNFFYFLIFYLQSFLSLVFFNNDFPNENKETSLSFINTFSYDFLKYFSIYIFFCFFGVNLLNKKNLIIFFKINLSFSYIIVFIGYFFFIFYFLNDYEIIERVFYYNDPSVVGYRFYSLLGEPRDASVYLLTNCFLIVVLFKNLTIDQKKKFYPYVFVIIFLSIIAFFLTKSFSGIVAIILGFLLFLFFLIIDFFRTTNKKKIKNIFFKITLLLIIILFFLMMFSLSNRISNYFSNIYLLITNSSLEIENLRIGSQKKDLMPLLKFAGDLINLEIKNIIFGNGSLSSYYFNSYEFSHPHSFLSRIIFDNGIIGFLIFSLFIYSVLDKKSDLLEKLLLSFAYGSFLSVHSTFLFVFLMIMIYLKKINFAKNSI